MISNLPVLVAHIGSLGDTLASLPGLRAIRFRYPKSEIHLLYDVQRDQRALAAEIIRPTGLVDQYIPYIFEQSFLQSIKQHYMLRRKLRSCKYQEVVCLLPSARGKWRLLRDRLFYALSGIPRSPSFVHIEFEPESDPKEADRRLARLERVGIPPFGPPCYSIEIPPETQRSVTEWLDKVRTFPRKQLVAICPGAKQSVCLWPLERFIALGAQLEKSVDCELIVLGGAEHREEAEKMIAAWSQGINGVGQFSVFETAAVLRECRLLVGLDTGTTHLAAAVGTTCVALYAQRELSKKWEPIGESHRIIRHPVDCQNCGLAKCNVLGHPCMTSITVERVLENALDALDSSVSFKSKGAAESK